MSYSLSYGFSHSSSRGLISGAALRVVRRPVAAKDLEGATDQESPLREILAALLSKVRQVGRSGS